MRKWTRAYSLLFLSFSFLILISGAAAQNTSQASQDDGKTVLVELDKATWISDIDWNPENRSDMIKVTVHSEIPKPIGIQEIPDFRGKSGSFSPMKQVTLSPGKNDILIPVNGRGNFGSGTLGVAITDSDDGTYYRKRNLFFFENITRFHFWGGLALVGLSVILQMFMRSKVSDMILKKVRELA